MPVNRPDPTITVPTQFTKMNNNGINRYEGIYLAKVVNIVDDRYEGYLYVDIIGHNFLGKTLTNNEEEQNM